MADVRLHAGAFERHITLIQARDKDNRPAPCMSSEGRNLLPGHCHACGIWPSTRAAALTMIEGINQRILGANSVSALGCIVQRLICLYTV